MERSKISRSAVRRSGSTGGGGGGGTITAGAGLGGGGALPTTIYVKPDNTSIEIVADTVAVKEINDTQHGHRGGGLLHSLATNLTAGFMSAADKIRLDQAFDFVANWDLTKVRYYFIDPVNGVDTNVGYVDDVAGATFPVGGPVGVPIKTLARLEAIHPPLGAGRSFVMLIRNAAHDTTGTNLAVDLNLASEDYKFGLCRASTDLSNDATDKITVGCKIAIDGPNVDKSWTVDTGGDKTCTVLVGGLTASPALIGMRIRFQGNVTAGLANVCTMILANTGSGITFSDQLASACAAGDKFWIETAGVRVTSVKFQGSFSSTDGYLTVGGGAVVGFESDAAMDLWSITGESGSAFNYWPSGNLSLTLAGGYTNYHLQNFYIDEVLGFNYVGSGGRQAGAGAFPVIQADWLNLGPFAVIGAASMTLSVGNYLVAGFLGSFYVDGILGMYSQQSLVGGDFYAIDCVITGNCEIYSRATAGTYNYLNIGGSFRAAGITGGFIQLNAISGGGATTVGLDFYGARNTTFILTNCTITGTFTDIQVYLAFTAYGALTVTGIRDPGGNHVQGAANITTFGEDGFNYSGAISNAGDIVRSNGTTKRYTLAQADTQGHADGVLGVFLTQTPATGDACLIATSGVVAVNFDAPPTVGALAYLYTTAGKATTTVPVANRKLRLGYVLGTVSGNVGLVAWDPEMLSVAADGLA